jgi:hypothetical protein
VLLSADQVFAAVRASGVVLEDNPAVEGENDSSCDVLTTDQHGYVREARRLQIKIDDNPDDDVNLVVWVMRDASLAQVLFESRKPVFTQNQARAVPDWHPFVHRNVEVEMQGQLPDALARQVRTAIEQLNVSATIVPPVMKC